jgi:hypothetical protein
LPGILVAALTGLGVGVVHAQPPAKAKPVAAVNYEITGVVLNSVTGDPVPHCHLTPNLNRRGGNEPRMGMVIRQNFGNRQFPAQTSEFDCDERGHFTVSVPSAGAWNLVANARGFVSAAYDEHAPYSSAVVLTAEAPTADLQFRLSPEASIVGQVLDEAGEPVRNAQVMLQNVPTPIAGGPEPVGGTRGAARTDDRGMYELPNLAPGSYKLSLHAQPWYAAANAQVMRTNDIGTSLLDPSLDFAYPVTWFPGESDAALAETIVLHAGDTRQADFHLVPMPSIHIRILVPPRSNNAPNTPPMPTFPLVQQISPGGGPNFVQTTTRYDQRSGEIDVGGLTPGMYQVRLAGQNQESHSAVVEVSANSTRTVDLNAPPSDMARIKVQMDGAGAETDSGPGRGGEQVTLVGTDGQRGTFFSNNGGGRRDQRDPNAERTLEVPPGRYEVVLQGRPNFFLTGLTAKGAQTAGRYVTVGAGDSALTVHVASGRATLSGVATVDGKPCVGALVLLVPITIEDPNSITILRQDQTNTDGSYDIASILPGQYILVAIDHGWQINWGDPSTLRRYLMQGVPVDLKSSAIVKQNVAAEAP